MRRFVFAAVIGLAIAGCGDKGAAPGAGTASNTGTEASAPEPKDEATALLEQLRGGSYQIDVAMGSMEVAMNRVRPLAAQNAEETREALQNIADMLDSAGATLIEFNDAPTLEDIRANFKQHDDHRLKAIEEADDARQEIEQARGIVADMLNSQPPADVKATLDEIDTAIDEALDAIEAAIEAFGGTIPEGGETSE